MPKRHSPVPKAKRRRKTQAELLQEVAALRRQITGLQNVSSNRPPAARVQTERCLASIIASAMDAIMTLDEEQRVVLFNAAAEQMFGCPASEALGASVDRFIPERFRAEHRRHLQRFRDLGETRRRMGKMGQVVGLRADGTEFPLESAISTMHIDGRWFFTVIHRDITDRVEAEQALAKERAFISTVLDTAGALVVVLDREGRIVRANRACERVSGYTFEDMQGRRLWDLFVAPEDVESVKAGFQELQSGRLSNEHEYHWLTRTGERRYLAWSNTVVVNEDGAMEYVVGTGLDFTERRKANALQAGEAIVLAMIDAGAPLPDILERICLFLEEQCDGSACAILAYEHGALRHGVAPSLPELVVHAAAGRSMSPEPGGGGIPQRERIVVSDVAHEPVGDSCRAMVTSHGWRTRWSKSILSSSGDGVLGLLNVYHREARGPNAEETNLLDLASHLAGIAFERQQSREALRHSHEALKALTARLLTAQDDERRRISRELHDDLNQRLAVLALNMQAAQRGMAESDRTRAVLQECYDEVVALSEDIRRLAYHLHPSILDDLGLEVALRAFVDDFARREGLAVTFTAERVSEALHRDAAACLYRIGQESLRNVARHACASNVTVTLIGSVDGVRLTITDDGVGFDSDRVRVAGRGLGLIGMQERIGLVGGVLTIRSQPGTGTEVSAWVPVRPGSS